MIKSKPIDLASLDEAQRLRLLVNSVTDYALYMLDPKGVIATWNPGARHFKGYEPSEIIGQHFSRFFREEDRAAGLPQHLLDTAAKEGRVEAEGWRVRKDGGQFWAHVIIDRVQDEDGALIGFAKITRDISDKREADLALNLSEQRFRLLIQAVRDYAIYMLDLDGVVTNWNSGAERIKGYSAEEIVGQHFSRFYTPEDRERGEPARALLTARTEGKYEKEGWRVRKDGTRFFASVVLDPILNDAGEHIGYVKITRDISERREAEIELEEARTALFQAQKLQALGEMTGGIAHDFNNLMTVIRGSADLLQRENLSDDKRRRYLQAIVETADRAATLTSHLLSFSRRQAMKPEVIDLNLRLDAFGEVLSRTLGGEFQVVLDLAPKLWLTEVDSTQLETALLNAAFNSRDAMPGGGRIILSTRNVTGDAQDLVCVSLADNGSGIPEEVLQRVFEPFFTTKPVGKGTGLGLSQIHGFAAQAGGRAEIESRAGVGTTIRIFLPRTMRALEAGRGDVAAERTRGRLTVLLVEDNDHVRDFARDLLESMDCEVVTAGDADEALAVLDRRPVDLVFSDVVMPGKSGVELAKIARARDPSLPILLASGYSEEVIGGAATGFEVLMKPFGAVEIEQGINAAMTQVGR
jgi:PAS domain S-box-containing protein